MPSSESQPAETQEQIMQKRVRATWDLFKDTEKNLIAKGNDKDFQIACRSLDNATCRKWLSFRVMIKKGNPLASFIVQELEGETAEVKAGPLKSAGEEKPALKTPENPLERLGFMESDDKKFFYAVIRDKYNYDKGLQAAKNRFKEIEVKYPSEEQALALLSKFKADFPEKAVAAFIDEENTFVYLSKSGTTHGKFKSDRVPGDTELFVIVISDK